MNYFKFQPEGAAGCSVTAYLQTEVEMYDKSMDELPAILICPGGGYNMVSEREAEPVAKEYFAAGYHAFVLYYSVGEKARDFEPLMQLAAAMAHIRSHAAEWHVDAGRIAVCGFSAGGHLAASLGTLYNDEKFLQRWNRKENIRPDAMVLGYPVITADEFANEGSILNVSGAERGSEEYAYFGLDRHVDAKTPTSFLWHTSVDDCVPVENSLRFAAALSAAKVPFEMHIFPLGGHGMSVCTREVNTPDPYNARWTRWSIEWLNRVFDFEK